MGKYSDNQFVKDDRGSPYDVQMSVVDGVKGTGIDGAYHVVSSRRPGRPRIPEAWQPVDALFSPSRCGSCWKRSAASVRAFCNMLRSVTWAILRSGMPLWRVPKELAGAAQFKVLFGQHKAVVAGLLARPAVRWTRPFRHRPAASNRIDARPRPTRPRNWWSWANPKRLAPSTSITRGRLGTFDAYFDHRRGDQKSASRVGKKLA